MKRIGGLVLENTGVCRLAGFPLSHAFSTTKLGNMSKKYGKETAKDNQARFFKLVGVESAKVVYILPEFENKVLIVNKEKNEGYQCDGLISFRKGVVLALCPGDCAPVFISDIDLTFVGLLHVGRKNLVEILDSAMAKIEDLGFCPKEIIVGIGPSIRECCYEIDMPSKIEEYLVSNHGIPTQQIFNAEVCTSCTQTENSYLFFSHRRSQNLKEPEGRFIAVAWL